jgi:1-deoxy-D-xylulose-5-phosphate reductoisomerase
VIKPLSLTDVGRLTFAAPDEDTFVLLRLARECMQKGGAMPAVLNAANEIAVAAFLKDQIGFLDIFDLVEGAVMSLQTGADAHTLDEILGYDRLAREAVRSSLKKMGR